MDKIQHFHCFRCVSRWQTPFFLFFKLAKLYYFSHVTLVGNPTKPHQGSTSFFDQGKRVNLSGYDKSLQQQPTLNELHVRETIFMEKPDHHIKYHRSVNVSTHISKTHGGFLQLISIVHFKKRVKTMCYSDFILLGVTFMRFVSANLCFKVRWSYCR